MIPGFRPELPHAELPPVELPPASRRDVLRGGLLAGAGLLIGFTLPARGPAPAMAATAAAGDAVMPNAFVRIAPDNTVTVLIKHLEMGQGVTTGLTTILADELDADWAQMRAEHAPVDTAKYANLLFGIQGTGGSTAVANSWEQLRKAGASARAMLVAAAAERWKVPASEITVSKGVVSHAASNRSAHFGELAEAAAKLPAPADVKLKDQSAFTLIGQRLPRLDSQAKTTGRARFGMDVALPDALVAVVARPSRFGATVASFDATAAKAVPGVVDVVAIPQGVAVLAKGMWAATRGREALTIRWDESKAETRGSDAILAEYRKLAATPGAVADKAGDAAAALAGAAKVLTAEFDFPYLAHAPMEPLNCTVKLAPDGMEIWTGCQFQTVDQANAARVAGLKPEQVRIHTLYAGGSFGRRATTNSDFIVEAVAVAKATGGKTPVKVIWTREDDVRGGYYRPMYHHALSAGLDAAGNIVGWRHRIVGQSILAGTPFEAMMVKDSVDATSVEGANNLPYAIPNRSVELHTVKSPVPVLWWRSVGSTHTAFAVETFLDELAHAAGKDPVAFRRAMLAGEPRHRAVLDLVAEKAGWGTPLPPGRARGIALHESFHSFVAQVAEVSQDKDGRVRVERVVCAVDCGVPVNPDVIRAQMEGGIGFGLGAIMAEQVTLTEGRVDQSNFHDYTPLRIDRMPTVEVHIVPSTAAPTGVGEPGVPPVGPAVANAVFALTGRRIRALPFAKELSV